MTWERRKHGTWTFYLVSGQIITATGALRFARDDDGWLVDYELEGSALVFQPSLDQVAAIAYAKAAA